MGKRRILSSLFASIITVTAIMTLTTGQQAAAACATLPTDKGTATQSVTLSAGTYTIWSRIRTAVPANNAYYMNVDNTNTNLLCNATMGGTTLTANTWTWVKYSATVTVSSGTAGAFNVTMAGKDDGVEVDRVIMTGDSSCIPNNTAVSISGVNYYGENCAPTDTTAPVVTVAAPTANQNLTGSTTNVTGNITDASTISNVSAYLDGSTTAAATDSTPSIGAYTIPLSLSGLSVGPHTLVVKATDADGNVGSSSQVTFVIPDTTAPIISVINAGSISQTSATVSWTTNEASDSQVEYGPTTSYGTSTTLASADVTSHSVNVSGLTAGTTYHYRVLSRDAANNLATSADGTFTTTAPAADTTAPTVSLTAPTAGTVSGAVTMTATASDASGIAGVQFQVNGVNQGAEDTSSPYSVSWNSALVTNGTYTLRAIARDTAGNTKTSTTVTVTVSNAATFLAADINQSGKVDIVDFSILAGNYNKVTAQLSNPRADINQSGKVDIVDFSLLAGKYGQ